MVKNFLVGWHLLLLKLTILCYQLPGNSELVTRIIRSPSVRKMLIQCNKEKEASIQVIAVQQAHLTSWLCSWEKGQLPQWPFGKWLPQPERDKSSPKSPSWLWAWGRVRNLVSSLTIAGSLVPIKWCYLIDRIKSMPILSEHTGCHEGLNTSSLACTWHPVQLMH